MNKKTIFVIILCFVVCIVPTFSKASSNTQIIYKSVDRAPRIQFDRMDEKNFTIKLVENGSISSVKLEKIKNGKSTVLINKNSNSNKVAKGITISNDMKEIKITSQTYLNTDTYTSFKLTAYDNNKIDKNRIVSYFNVKKSKVKNAEKGWYAINDSPRLSYSDGFTIKVKDNSKIKSLTVKDRNNKNAVIKIGNPLRNSTEVEKSYKIDLSKLVAKNNMYFLELTAVDQTGIKRTEEIIVKTTKKAETTSTNQSQNTTQEPSTSVTPSTSNNSSTVPSISNTSKENTTCNHSYGRLYTRKSPDKKCTKQYYYVCSKCSFVNVIKEVHENGYMRDGTLRNINKNNPCIVRDYKKCKICGYIEYDKGTRLVHGADKSYTVKDKNNPCRKLKYTKCEDCGGNVKYIGEETEHTIRQKIIQPTYSNHCTRTIKTYCIYCSYAKPDKVQTNVHNFVMIKDLGEYYEEFKKVWVHSRKYECSRCKMVKTVDSYETKSCG